ncbi:MAG: putative domain and cyclic nucleotide-regulated nucleotidyltransferase [Anaeromyxobacteraceae bacterium]|nr:putative domain and cyclic nucleotide-regulated nucleotidyltransferase [Anaeromyxobacteraceae bacterium]
MTALDPVSFVRSTPPFDSLPQELFDGAARSLEVIYYPAATRLVTVGDEPLKHLYVIRKGAVRLERGGQTLQVLEEGETFGYTSLITGKATLDCVVEEDLLAYRIPGEEFHRLLSDARFAAHFTAGLATRLESSLEHSPVATFRVDLAAPVETLVRRAAVWVEAAATVGDAARTMVEQRVSSVMVRGETPGIVTDRDFRVRVLAQGLGPETPVARVLSRPVKTVEGSMPVHEAWTVLLEANVHHLPVERDGEILGLVTDTDLLKHTSQGPVAVLRLVDKLPDRESLPGYSRKVTEMVAALLAGGLNPVVIAGFVAQLNDALMKRILRWAEDDLGEPPAPYAWIALGSEGRGEQTLLTDQDNALVFADEGAGSREYYTALADRANTDLAAAGFPRCPGGYMARNHCGTLSEWRDRFAGWVGDPTAQGVLEAAIFFDFRRVAGSLDLAPLQDVLDGIPRREAFLRSLVRQALEFRPPPQLLLRLRSGADLDLKRQGIAPVVFLARCYGLAVGSHARSTLERLRAATRAGLMGTDASATVIDAYRYLLGLRLRMQLKMLSEGKPATNIVSLAQLSAIERSRLKDSLRAIGSWQDKAAYRYQVV